MPEENLSRQLFGHGILATLLLSLTLLLFSVAALPLPNSSIALAVFETLLLVTGIFAILALFLDFGARGWLKQRSKYAILFISMILIWLSILIFNIAVAAAAGQPLMSYVWTSDVKTSLLNWIYDLGGAFLYLLIIMLLIG